MTDRIAEIAQAKDIASLNLAHALRSIGFLLTGYRATKHNPEFELGSWVGGTATHPAYPGSLVVCEAPNTKRGAFWSIAHGGQLIAHGTGYKTIAATGMAAQAIAGDIVGVHIVGFLEEVSRAEESYTYECLDGVTITRNLDLNGIEIRFPGKPSATVRDWLKLPGRRYRYSEKGGDNRWWLKYTPALLAAAIRYFVLVEKKEG
jgi:hypothetical protein